MRWKERAAGSGTLFTTYCGAELAEATSAMTMMTIAFPFRFEISNIGGHLIPLAQLPKRMGELNTGQEIIAVCKMGPRGVKAVEYLQQHGFQRVSNLRGGLFAWSDRIDRSVPRY